jgi:hypothetical protein
MDLKIIGMQDEDFRRMVEEIVSRLKDQIQVKEDKWIDGEEAMHILRITSKTTLQKLRDEGKIRFSQPEKKLILYDRDSILQYIEKHARETF